MRQIATLRWILTQPLNKGKRLVALRRWVLWHIGARLVPGPVIIPFVNNLRYIAQPGMTGATGNFYAGLVEFEEMSFMVHFLRSGDEMVDVGANVGMFTLLAASVEGVRVIAFEPVPETFSILQDNVRLNRLECSTRLINAVVGEKSGIVSLSYDLGQANRVLTDHDHMQAVEAESVCLDDVLKATPTFLKIDVEGYELAVLRGASGILKEPGLQGMIIECKNYGKRFGFSQQELLKRILEAGFYLVSYEPMSRTLAIRDHTFEQISGNCLFVRDIDDARRRLRSAVAFRVAGWTI